MRLPAYSANHSRFWSSNRPRRGRERVHGVDQIWATLVLASSRPIRVSPTDIKAALDRVDPALRDALGDKSGITRFGDSLVPLDETLVQAAVDLSGRPYVVHEEPGGMAPLIGSYDTTLTRHIFESMAASAGICLHVRVLYGRNPHHIVEAQFKAVARALRTAVAPDPRAGGIPSTKGVL